MRKADIYIDPASGRLSYEFNNNKYFLDGKLEGIDFRGVISLDTDLTKYNNFTVSSALAVALDANPSVGGSAEIRFIGDGSTTPTFSSSFTASATSDAYDPTLAAINKVIFYYDGTTAFYSVTVL
jgi:hypothetical protein